MPLGPMELVIIAGVALLVFGPKRLPELAKGVGKGVRDFKKALEGKDDNDDKNKSLPPDEEKEPIDVTNSDNDDTNKSS